MGNAQSDLFSKLSPLINNRCGVLRRLERLQFPADLGMQMHAYQALVGRPSALHPLSCRAGDANGQISGYGTAADDATARVRAICEGIERYCSTMYPTRGVLVATAAELGDEALDPTRLPQCSPTERERGGLQLRLASVNQPERWIRGYSLTHERAIWVPLTATYMGLPDPVSDHLVVPQSTGFATGGNYDQAVLSALCEVIERDSIVLWWLHQLPVPRICPDALLDDQLTELLERAQGTGIQSHFLDLTSEVGVPVVGLIQLSERHRPHALFAAASRMDGLMAARRVMEEAGSVRLALHQPRNLNRNALLKGIPQSPESFGQFYAGPDGPARFAFATQGAAKATLPESVNAQDPVPTLVDRFRSLGMEIIVVDVTLPEIREFGLVVVRVIVPEMMTVTFCHGIRYLGHPRLYAAPERLGYGHRNEEMVTNDPLPFA